MADRARFIELVLTRELDLASGTLTAAAVSAFLDAQGFGAASDSAVATAELGGARAKPPSRHAKLLELPLASLTADRVASLAAEKAAALQALAQLQATSAASLWRSDLAVLEKELRKDLKLAAGQRTVFLPTTATADTDTPGADASAPATRVRLAK